MRHFVRLLVWPLVALGLSLGTSTLLAETAAHPYLGIAGSNVFRLQPMQLHPTVAPPPPLAKVRLVGITTLGDKRALLKVRLPANPPAPAKEISCILAVGQWDGPVEVLEIGEVAGTVKVKNSETVMMLTFEKESPRPQPPSLPPDLPPTPPMAIRPER
jgi:hypothetical protein